MRKDKNMENMKLLLLNPPGKKIYFRDYYCSKVSKAKYYYHPLDLVYLSGRLNFKLKVIDAIAEVMSPQNCLSEIKKFSPDIIIFLISAPSYSTDVDFMSAVKQVLPESKIIGTGDIYRDLREDAFSTNKFLDAIFTDFSTGEIIKYIENANQQVINNVIYRYKGKIISGPEKHYKGTFSMGIPRWDLFNIDAYNFPFARKKKFATVLTDFGCPYSCTYCPISTLGYKVRELDEVIQEIKLLKSIGVNELFIRDQTFGVNKKRTLELCKRMIHENLNLSWTAFTRVDVVNEEIILEMKKAGCHTIMFGIETLNENLLKKYKKDITIEQIKNALILCKKKGIRTVGTFIIGLPGDTPETIQYTIDMATEMPLDFASFNIATPRFGTSFRSDAKNMGIIDETKIDRESSKSVPIWKGQEMTNEEIFYWHKKAIKDFYLRPKYILKRIKSIKTYFELVQTIREGIYLLKGT